MATLGMTTLNRAEKILAGLIGIAVLAIFATFMALSFFNYPVADDFCAAAKARDLGFFKALAFWYQNWSGRYTLHSVWTAVMMPQDIFQTYRIAPMLLLTSTWLSFSFLIARIAQGRLLTHWILLLGGISSILFIAGVPDVAQTFYWMGGSITYQLANILLLLLLGLLVWRETTAHNDRRHTLIFWLSSLLVIAIIGANEISLFLTVSILCCGALYAVWTRRDSRMFWIVLLVIALIAALISVLAPGNYQRYSNSIGENDSTLRPPIWLAVTLYFPWVSLRILYWLSNLGIWASGFILLAVTVQPARTLLYREGKFRKSWLLLPALWLILLFLLNAIGFVINRYPLPERAESVVYLLFLLGGSPVLIILGHFLMGDGLQRIDRQWIAPAAALLLINLLGTPNVFEAYKDSYRGYRYHQEQQDRIAAIQAAKKRGETEIVVASLSHPPRTLFATDIATDPGNFRNECLSEYYQVHSIRLGASGQR